MNPVFKWTGIILTALGALCLCYVLNGCTMVPDHPTPSQIYPDASTPVGLAVPGTKPGQAERNGGIIDDIVLNGRPYNVVTDNFAANVQKWQGNQNGFVLVAYRDSSSYFPYVEGIPTGYYRLWAIDKGTVFKYDTHGWQ